MLTDARIEVPRDISKRIARIICEEIKQSLEKNRKYYRRAKRNSDAYNQVTKYMSQNKIPDKPWLGASDYFIGLIEWVIDAVWARTMNTLFSQEPYMTAVGEGAEDKPKEEGVTDFTDAILREKVKLYDNTNFYFKQSLILPFSVCKYDWVSEYDTVVHKEKAHTFVSPQGEEQYLLPDDPQAMIQALQFQANGYTQQGMKDVWVREDIELKNQSDLKYVRFEDYVWAPEAKRDTNLYWEGDRFWLTINDMRREARQDKFIKDNVRMVEEQAGYGQLQGSDMDLAVRTEHHECFNWCGRLPFDEKGELNLDDPDAIEQEVACQVAYKAEELLQIKHWDHSRLPQKSGNRVYLRLEFEETEDFGGRSLADKLYMTNRELNALHNTIMNNAMIAMQKIFVKKANLAGDKWAKPKVFPGAVWEEDQTGDIRVLEVGDVKNIGLEMEQTLLNFAERISNVSIFTTGANREKGQKTLGEVQATLREGNIGMDKFIQRCHNVLREICKWTVDYYHDRMPPGLERRIRGEEGELVFPTPENMQLYQQKGVKPYWSEDDVAGPFDFTWRGTSLNSSKEWQLAVANDMMDRYLPHPMIAQNMLATWEILKRGLIARGVKDWDAILPKKEAIIQEMKRMQQQAVMEKQARAEERARGQQPNVAQQAVEKLVKRGMPRDEALKAVKQRVQNEKAIATT